MVTAVTWTARRGMQGYADPAGGELRAELARRHGFAAGRVAVGHGAAQLLEAASQELLGPGDELLSPWPTYPLYPLLARRCGAQAVPARGSSVDALAEAVTQRTRLVMLCSPNDPTGEAESPDGLRGLLEGLPERVVVVLDEALVDFAAPGQRDATLHLLEDHPRLLVVRTFSKAWGLGPGRRALWLRAGRAGRRVPARASRTSPGPGRTGPSRRPRGAALHRRTGRPPRPNRGRGA